MDNVRPEGTEDQYVTSTSGESLEGNVHVRHSKHIRKIHRGTTKDLGLLERGRMTMLQV